MNVNPSDHVIVSRHRAAIEFVARHIARQFKSSDDRWAVGDGEVTVTYRVFPSCEDEEAWCPAEGMDRDLVIPVITGNARPEEVHGKTVYGNVPLALAAEAHVVYAIEFDGTPPRGQEYDLAAMDAAGARLVAYTVRKS